MHFSVIITFVILSIKIRGFKMHSFVFTILFVIFRNVSLENSGSNFLIVC